MWIRTDTLYHDVWAETPLKGGVSFQQLLQSELQQIQYLMVLDHSLSYVTINISVLWVKKKKTTNNLDVLFGNSVHKGATDTFFTEPIPILIISNHGNL